MIRSPWQTRAFATILAFVAGYIDASGFLASGGFFVSFMSGNSTRMGVGWSQGAGAVAAGLIAAFLLGVIGGSLAGHAAPGRQRAAVLGLVTVLLAASAALAGWDAIPAALAAMAMAMGAVNNIFERDGEVSIGVTYMTGSLVKLGQRIATALRGSERFGWVPYLVLWLGFVAGVAFGAAIYPKVGLADLWGAALTTAVLAIVAPRTQATPTLTGGRPGPTPR